jgi:hypothetical protein
MATHTPTASFKDFPRLPAELQARVIELAWNHVLACREKITILRFSQAHVAVHAGIPNTLSRVSKPFHGEVIHLSRSFTTPILHQTSTVLPGNFNISTTIPFIPSTDTLELDVQRVPEADIYRFFLDTSHELREKVQHLRLRFCHDMYSEFAAWGTRPPMAYRVLSQISRVFGRTVKTVELVGVKERELTFSEDLTLILNEGERCMCNPATRGLLRLNDWGMET